MDLGREKNTQVDTKFKFQIKDEALPFCTPAWGIPNKLNSCSRFIWKEDCNQDNSVRRELETKHKLQPFFSYDWVISIQE